MPRRDAPPLLDADWWNIYCEKCNFKRTKLDSRDDAITIGKAHATARHADEYEFRIVGVKKR